MSVPAVFFRPGSLGRRSSSGTGTNDTDSVSSFEVAESPLLSQASITENPTHRLAISSSGGLPLYTSGAKGCCGCFKRTYIFQAFAFLFVVVIWSYMFNMAQEVKLRTCLKASGQLRLEVDNMHQTMLSEKLSEGPSAVKEWGNEAQMEKMQLRVLELEQSIKEAQQDLRECKGADELLRAGLAARKPAAAAAAQPAHQKSKKPKKL